MWGGVKLVRYIKIRIAFSIWSGKFFLLQGCKFRIKIIISKIMKSRKIWQRKTKLYII